MKRIRFFTVVLYSIFFILSASAHALTIEDKVLEKYADGDAGYEYFGHALGTARMSDGDSYEVVLVAKSRESEGAGSELSLHAATIIENDLHFDTNEILISIYSCSDLRISMNADGYFIVVYTRVNDLDEVVLYYNTGRVYYDVAQGNKLSIEIFGNEIIVPQKENPGLAVSGNTPDVALTGGGTVLLTHVGNDGFLYYRSGFIYGLSNTAQYINDNEFLYYMLNYSYGEVVWSIKSAEYDTQLGDVKDIDDYSIAASYNSSEVYGGLDTFIFICIYSSGMDVYYRTMEAFGTQIKSVFYEREIQGEWEYPIKTPRVAMSEEDQVIIFGRSNSNDYSILGNFNYYKDKKITYEGYTTGFLGKSEGGINCSVDFSPPGYNRIMKSWIDGDSLFLGLSHIVNTNE